MKIDLHKIKHTPSNMKFNFCVYGEPTQEIKTWVEYWDMELVESNNFTNIIIPNDVMYKFIFTEAKVYDYMDGFSPNLNKELHVGHLSNLIMASALQNLGVAKEGVAILGDTLEGNVSQIHTKYSFLNHIDLFNYKVSTQFMASEMKFEGNTLKDGQGDYVGTKVFEVGDEKIVGIKSDGSTSYFYQDVSLAEELDGSTLYLTGTEQNNHFNNLKLLYPNINHLGLGLVNIDGEKMSSRKGNVILVNDFINEISEKVDKDFKLTANIIIGKLLMYSPESNKKINVDTIANIKESEGLYLSYTMARLKSAGLEVDEMSLFDSKRLEFSRLRAKENLNPSILFKELVDLCKLINNQYGVRRITHHNKNKNFFQAKLNDLALGMKLLGMHEIDKV